MSNNTVTLDGYLARNCSVYGEGDKLRALNSLGVNNGKTESGEQRPASFFNIIGWNAVGKALAEGTEKGQRVRIEGRLRERRTEAMVQNPETGALEKKILQTVEVVVTSFIAGQRSKKSREASAATNMADLQQVLTGATGAAVSPTELVALLTKALQAKSEPEASPEPKAKALAGAPLAAPF